MNADYVIICPTPRGGHIEHAIELAIALSDVPGSRTSLLSRSGAAEYVRSVSARSIVVREVIPPLPTSRSALIRFLSFIRSVVREYRAVRTVVKSSTADEVLILIEEPRYPWIWPFKFALGPAVTVIGIVHNAREHERSRSLLGRLRSLIRSQFVRRADGIVVHGESQAVLMGRRNVKVAQLPNSSQLAPGSMTAIPSEILCLGEIRRNKGLDFAIAACEEAGLDLTIAGALTEPAYEADFWQSVAQSTVAPHVLEGFLSPSEFQARLAGARVVLLPYSHFDAQSGVLARAIELGRAIVCADHRSLREQAGDYPAVQFVAFGSVSELAAVIGGEWIDNWYGQRKEQTVDEASDLWRTYARAVTY